MSDTTLQAALRAAFNSRLPLSGGTMTGALILSGDPAVSLGAATKQYVDSSVSAISWDSLTGKPNFATVATTGSYNDLLNTPSLATVATTGNYNDLTNKPSFPPTPAVYVTQRWRSGSDWYRVWSDGFIEQGGVINGGGYNSPTTVSLNKYMKTNYYTATATVNGDAPDSFDYGAYIVGKTTTSFRLVNSINGGRTGSEPTSWKVCGY